MPSIRWRRSSLRPGRWPHCFETRSLCWMLGNETKLQRRGLRPATTTTRSETTQPMMNSARPAGPGSSKCWRTHWHRRPHWCFVHKFRCSYCQGRPLRSCLWCCRRGIENRIRRRQRRSRPPRTVRRTIRLCCSVAPPGRVH